MSDGHKHDDTVGEQDDLTSGALAPTVVGSSVPGASRTDEPVGVPERDTLAGRYELLALLGQGGMGNVYKAHDRDLDEIVALKTLRRDLTTSPQQVARFRSEVKLARRVTHTNVVRTYDLGVADDQMYLTMEYVDGRDLGHLLRQDTPLSAHRFLELARPICEGLEAAHEVGVIHRDLKPHNVLVADDGRVVLTDFGIARAIREQSHLTNRGSGPVGTPAYMAPEQVRGTDTVGERSDIYSLGVLFFEMLAGELPFQGETVVKTALARLLEQPPSLARARPDLPTRLVRIVQTCLAREPGRRFQSAAELLAELDAVEAVISGSSGLYSTAGTTQRGHRTRSASSRLRALHHSVVGAQWDTSKSVAVMPFRYQGEEGGEYLADGLTEELIDELSMSRGLKVRPRGAVVAYRGSDASAQEMGRELGVQVVVDGAVRRLGDKIRVRVALVGVEDGFQIWASRFEGTPAELFDISEEAARAIVDALSAEELATHRPGAIGASAVETYMQARQQMHASWFGDLSGAIRLFEKALVEAPADPRLLSGAATARARAAFFGGPEAAEHLEKATDCAKRAIAAAGERCEPHLALARVHFARQDFGPALASLRAALGRSPSSAAAHDLLGRILRETGPIEVAIEHMETALELDPQLHTARWDLAQAYALHGDWARVDELLVLGVDSEDHLNARESARSRTDLWRDQPRWLDADNDRPISPMSPHIRLMSHHRGELLRSGRFTDDYHALIDEVIASTHRGTRLDILMRQVRAECHAAVGEVDQAVAAVHDAVDAGLLDLVWLEHCSVFEAARERPHFEVSLAEVRERIRDIARRARAS